MREARTVIIGLQVNDQVIDLKIPTAVSVKRLNELLGEVLVLQQITLPKQYHLAFKDKPILLSDGALVSDYPIGNGDQLVLIPH